jgi:hypothetical protein
MTEKTQAERERQEIDRHMVPRRKAGREGEREGGRDEQEYLPPLLPPERESARERQKRRRRIYSLPAMSSLLL